MLEIVFSDSAAGCLAQAPGLNVSYQDICPLNLALSVGEISERSIGPQRKTALLQLMGVFPDTGREAAQTLFASARRSLSTLLTRARGGEPVRIWCSSSPDEACGACWLMEQLQAIEFSQPELILASLPAFTLRPDGAGVRYSSWGEVSPKEWSTLASLGRPLSGRLAQAMARHWEILRVENAPLRAVLNGQLVSAPEDLYDSFLYRELNAVPGEFMEAALIGCVLGRYQLGVSDGWLALRIERLIQSGLLAPLSAPAPGGPIYHRILRKC